MNVPKIITRLSLAAGLCILVMFVVSISTGVSQEKFEITRDVASYARSLIDSRNQLRLLFSLDLIFITIFTTLFVVLTQHLRTGEKVADAIANIAMGTILITGFLDFYEDLHIITMMQSVFLGLSIEQTDISTQMLWSMIKFFTSYFCLFLIAFILPARTLTEKVLKYSLWFVQLPVGILVYTAPAAYVSPFNLVRFAFMTSGFFLLAYNFSQRREDKI